MLTIVRVNYIFIQPAPGVDVIIKLITVFEVLVDLVGSVILTFTFRSLLT